MFRAYQDMSLSQSQMIAIGFGILIAFFGMVWEVVDILVRNTVLDTWATMFLLSSCSWCWWRGRKPRCVQCRVWPPCNLFEKHGPDYTGSLISYDREASEVAPNGGDVLVGRRGEDLAACVRVGGARGTSIGAL